jgi:hypothetical protein
MFGALGPLGDGDSRGSIGNTVGTGEGETGLGAEFADGLVSSMILGFKDGCSITGGGTVIGPSSCDIADTGPIPIASANLPPHRAMKRRGGVPVRKHEGWGITWVISLLSRGFD